MCWLLCNACTQLWNFLFETNRAPYVCVAEYVYYVDEWCDVLLFSRSRIVLITNQSPNHQRRYFVVFSFRIQSHAHTAPPHTFCAWADSSIQYVPHTAITRNRSLALSLSIDPYCAAQLSTMPIRWQLKTIRDTFRWIRIGAHIHSTEIIRAVLGGLSVIFHSIFLLCVLFVQLLEIGFNLLVYSVQKIELTC